jgi:hypothetical protein
MAGLLELECDSLDDHDLFALLVHQVIDAANTSNTSDYLLYSLFVPLSLFLSCAHVLFASNAT